jgi:hypothetical protein
LYGRHYDSDVSLMGAGGAQQISTTVNTNRKGLGFGERTSPSLLASSQVCCCDACWDVDDC